jgi:hypothetical protein
MLAHDGTKMTDTRKHNPLNAKYRIAGHEGFSCRFAWLPKVVRILPGSPKLFSSASEDDAIVALGMGKNMVRSLRFWAQAMGVAAPSSEGEGHVVTTFGKILLGEDGLDEFLEDIRTLWLLHWNLSTNLNSPLLAWDYLLNRWHEPEIVPRAAINALHKEAIRQDAGLSCVTVEQHFDTFLHTYIPTRSRKGEIKEDNLDCPLVELELIVKVGDRETETSPNRREPIYSFRREEKPDITAEAFIYCLNDFWQKRHAADRTLTLKEVAHGHGSPGQVFKLPEENIRARVDELTRQTRGFFSYSASATQQLIIRQSGIDSTELLRSIYQVEEQHA